MPCPISSRQIVVKNTFLAFTIDDEPVPVAKQRSISAEPTFCRNHGVKKVSNSDAVAEELLDKLNMLATSLQDSKPAVIKQQLASMAQLSTKVPCPSSVQSLQQKLPRDQNQSHTAMENTSDAMQQHKEELITTAMVRNIPYSYTEAELTLELDELGFKGKYNFVRVPVKKKKRMSCGYAFVNLKTQKFYNEFREGLHNHRFKRHQDASQRKANVSPATCQGLKANIERAFGKLP